MDLPSLDTPEAKALIAGLQEQRAQEAERRARLLAVTGTKLRDMLLEAMKTEARIGHTSFIYKRFQ